MSELFNHTLIEQGGPTMWLLFAISLIGFIIFVERTLFLHKGQIHLHDFVEGIENLIRKRRILEALTVCEETPGPVANVVKSAILHHQNSEDELRRAIQTAALVEIPVLEKRVGTLAAIARVAPLIGLVGTLLAALGIFQLLQTAGPYLEHPMAAGLMIQAILSSVTGICIAIMAHLGHHFLYGRLRAILHDLEWAGHDIMQLLLRMSPQEPESSDPESGSSK